MKSALKLFFALVVVLMTSCSQNRYIVAPPFTDVMKITSLKKGMSLSEVNTTLGIAPFNMFVSEQGNSIYSYNYRLKERKIPVNNIESFVDRPSDPSSKSVNSEESQKFGSDYYTFEKVLYITFKDDKLVTVISDDGLQKATQIMAITGSLSILREDPQFKVLPDALLNNNVVVPIDDKGNYIPNPSGGAGSAAGFIYMGNGTGVSALPATNPREIKGPRVSRKARLDIFPNRKKRNKGTQVNFESDF